MNRFRDEHELKPFNLLSVSSEFSESSPQLKTIKSPLLGGKFLHLFEYHDPVVIDLHKEEENETQYIVHDVTPYDTLDGLAFQYNVSATAIKTANNLSSDDIFFYKQLNIPQGSPKAKQNNNQTPGFDDVETEKAQKIELLGGLMNESDKKVVESYLEANKWDVDSAYKTFKAEEELNSRLNKDEKGTLNKEKRTP